MSQSEQNPRIWFRSYVGRKTQAGEVYQYLLENPIWNAIAGKDMAASALTAFFLPYARQGHQSSAQDKATARFAIDVLQRQIAKIQADFEIDVPIPPAPISPLPIQPEAHLEEVPQSKATSKKTVPEAFYGAYDLFES